MRLSGDSGPPSPAAGQSELATDEALRAIAEPRRRAILRLVAHNELAAGEIAAAFDVTRTAISQHLTVLKNAGLLAERRDGTRRLYRARPAGLAGLRELAWQPPERFVMSWGGTPVPTEVEFSFAALGPALTEGHG